MDIITPIIVAIITSGTLTALIAAFSSKRIRDAEAKLKEAEAFYKAQESHTIDAQADAIAIQNVAASNAELTVQYQSLAERSTATRGALEAEIKRRRGVEQASALAIADLTRKARNEERLRKEAERQVEVLRIEIIKLREQINDLNVLGEKLVAQLDSRDITIAELRREITTLKYNEAEAKEAIQQRERRIKLLESQIAVLTGGES